MSITTMPVKEYGMGVHQSQTRILNIEWGTLTPDPVGERRIAPPPLCTNQLRTGLSDTAFKVDRRFLGNSSS
jgi:hypothetical protein